MRSNKLKLNPGKTHFMMIGTAERLRITPDPIQVTMDNILLKEDLEKSELLLGCQIQANMKWHMQISVLLEKLRKRVVGLLNLQHIAPYALKKTITEGIFNSVLVYCIPLYGLWWHGCWLHAGTPGDAKQSSQDCNKFSSKRCLIN